MIKEGKLPDKVKALKSLIIMIIHDETFPRMIMTVITFLVPIQTDNKPLKKILLFYWEIIEKLNKDGKLKEEMFFVILRLSEWVTRFLKMTTTRF